LLVLHPTGRLAGIGELGQIAVRTPYLTEGYLGDDALTQERFIVNPYTRHPQDRVYLTGDLARFLPDGHIELHGRNDAQVKIRGFRIELGEIEAALLKHPLIRNAVVAVREDAPDDQQLAAYLVTQHSAMPTAVQLRSFLLKHLPDYMIPTAFVQLETLPLTPNGKVDRKALSTRRARTAAGSAPAPKALQPRNPLELQILLAWQRILKVKAISIHDNFFDLGGHSLLAVRLVNEINKTLNLSLSIPVFFLNPTIAGIAAAIEKDKHDQPQPQLIPLRSGQPGRSLFFLDASMGLCQLAQLLDAETASFATNVPLPDPVIQAAAQNDKRGLPSLERLAAPHTALIQKHQPAGNCLLVGHSFGGLLAFEVAHQLQQQGRTVEMIVLVDSWAAYPAWWQKIKVLSMTRAWSSLRFRTRHGWLKTRDRLRRALGRPADASLPHQESELPQADIAHPTGKISWGIFKRINWHARNHYQTRPLDSRAVLFRAQRSELASYYPIANRLGWDGLLKRGLEVVDTPGDHFTLLKEPHVQILAEQLNQRLQKTT
jgi:thioesterase domain-containing protein/acyl carrier protein